MTAITQDDLDRTLAEYTETRERLVRGTRRRMLLLYLIMVAALCAGSYSLHEEALRVDQGSYDRCLDRNINITKVNDFYRTMSRIEATNEFIDQATRDRRIAAYAAVQLAPANCGEKP